VNSGVWSREPILGLDIVEYRRISYMPELHRFAFLVETTVILLQEQVTKEKPTFKV
jgi:hypothetical protein